MVGEGILFECLQNKSVDEILLVSRKHYDFSHPKLKELLVSDFNNLNGADDQLKNYDACFFCAGISSVGMKEEKYRHITYDTTLSFAKVLSEQNPDMTFIYVSGAGTDSSEKGSLMWARVKGKTENDLIKLPFKGVYAFRPGIMQPFKGQKNWKPAFKAMVKVLKLFVPKKVLTLHEVGKAMVNAAKSGYEKNVLGVNDIKILSSR